VSVEKQPERTIVLHSRRYGELKVDLNEVIHFPRGIPGFERYKRYALFESEEIQPFQWLICVDNEELGFVIIPPHYFAPDYNPRLYESDLQELAVEPEDKLAIFAIVTLAPNPTESTANLQGPLVININKKLGKQVVIVDEEYSVKYPIIQKKKEKKQVAVKV